MKGRILVKTTIKTGMDIFDCNIKLVSSSSRSGESVVKKNEVEEKEVLGDELNGGESGRNSRKG